MIFDADAPAVILSPHLDDAVLSAFTRLDPPPIVVTVFAGVPADDAPLTLWDRLCGFASSADAARARLLEDDAALDPLDVPHDHLPWLDALNREARDAPTTADLLTALGAFSASLCLAPLAGGPRPHPDHRIARDAARALLGRIPVELYADFPYCAKTGRDWPVSFGGSTPDPRWMSKLLRDVPELGGAWLDARVQTLGGDLLAAKREAMETYRSQFSALDRKLRVRGLVSDPALYGREVFLPLYAPA